MGNFIKKNLGEVIFILGLGLFVYNIFNFSYKTYNSLSFFKKNAIENAIEGEYLVYYYQNDTLAFITLGAMLICTGIFLIKKYKIK